MSKPSQRLQEIAELLEDALDDAIANSEESHARALDILETQVQHVIELIRESAQPVKQREEQYFFIRQHDTNRPVGCCALKLLPNGNVKVSLSVCAPSDFHDKNRGWNRQKAVDSACGKLASPRLGVEIAGGEHSNLLNYVSQRISARMWLALLDMDANFLAAHDMLLKQIEFLRRRESGGADHPGVCDQ